jgi:hypothetical protein
MVGTRDSAAAAAAANQWMVARARERRTQGVQERGGVVAWQRRDALDAN